MIRVLAVGLIIVAATLGGAAFSVQAGLKSDLQDADKPYFGGLDYVKTEAFGAPVISEGVLEGYIVSQWVFTMDASLRASMSVPVELIMTEMVFRAIYEEDGIDFDNLDRIDFDGLSARIREALNQRLGADGLVQDVMVQKFDYVEREDLRDGKARSLLNAAQE